MFLTAPRQANNDSLARDETPGRAGPDGVRVIRFRPAAPAARIYLAEDFAAEREVAAILSAAGTAAGQPPISATAKHDQTGFSFEMPVCGQPALQALAARMQAAFGFSNRQGTTMRFRRYAPGEAHPPHCDTFQIGDMHLVATAMLWLQEPGGGGETLFPNAAPGGLRLVPRRGSLAVWLNTLADGTADLSAAHEGLPVTSGTKTTLTSFIYADPGATPDFAASA